ncbi:hypothetical protein CIW49_06830 [Mycolicibacterium sp. P1-18]|uniref:hypothetical protein n=1 Tax=Mycolicibacterium sp. P1-18 TaxID=2024615 RepID=UPI0011F30782|nr:hypothetical protein [Mycolicibacterium sp. P1-18]KAA0101198.1 hypothetical protein CIW49_06830 [Mycolicibacterium sp. P1-18]
MTHFRTSVTALEPDAHYVRASQLTTRPGTLPAITIPVAGGRWPDADAVWSYLAEPAEFFGITMPARAELADALTSFAATTPDAVVAATVVIVESAEGSHVVVTGVAVQPLRSAPVRVVADDTVPPVHRASDPWWRRMAARTTSRAEVDQRERWLDGRGYADALSAGVPLLGALVVETPRGVVGVENPEPTSVLEQLASCGWFEPIPRAATTLADARHAWWVSPRFETHPVAELAGVPLPSTEAVPSFARWS